MKKNGFTLIELLAVIIILGILMIIAIPSVTRYISDSRKSAYVDTAKEIISGARNFVNEGKVPMYDTNVTYYIDYGCVKTENASKSPYGEFDKAYVIVTYDGKGYNYYWVSRDETGQGIPDPIAIADLDEDDIVSDISFDYIKEDKPQEGKNTIKVLKSDNCNEFKKEPIAAEQILETALAANQLKQIPNTDIYIFKGGTNNPPANYVKFNNEDWRIIGIYGDQLKIIRVNPRGYPTAPTGFTGIQWNTTTPNSGWANSSLKEILNTTYYDSLNQSSKDMIDENGSWNVGPVAYYVTAHQSYTNSITSGTVGNVTHTTPWIGKVGLIAAYEYLYASDGPDCDSVTGNNGSFNTLCGTLTYDWLAQPSLVTLSPYNGGINDVLYLPGSALFYTKVTNTYKAVPAVFLKRNVKITKGDGTSENPYELSL